jgi:CRISPR-associated protein Cas1
MIASKSNKVVSVLVPVEADMRANTRMMQYEAYHSQKGINIANAFVRAKIQSDINFIENHDLPGVGRLEKIIGKLDIRGKNVDEVRNRIQVVEAQASRIYLKEFFKQFPDELNPNKRYKFGARDPLNNLLNLSYEVLKREIILAMVPMHLDPYLGFLHSYFRFKQSLVYDLIEPFRVVAEKFVLTYHTSLSKNSFEKVGKRVFLTKEEEVRFITAMNKTLKKRAPYQRYGKPVKARIKTIIKEEPIKLAQYIRNKHQKYQPHIMK